MRKYSFGQTASLRKEVRDLDGELTNATVLLVLTKPDGTDIERTPVNPSVGVYDAAVTDLAEADAGVWDYEWQVSGAVTDRDPGQFYVTDPDNARPPLVSFTRLVSKIGYVPEGSEQERAEDLLDEASELIRDVAEKTWLDDDGALQAVPFRVQRICLAAAYRAFENPDGLTQRSIGDSSKSYDRAGREGGEAVYLTRREQEDIRKAGGVGTGGMVSVTLVSPYSGPDLDTWQEVTAE